MHMHRLLKKVFLLVFPFLWKKKRARVATFVTVSLIGLHTLVHAVTPWLLGYLLRQYQKLAMPALLGLVALLLLCWYAGGALGHLRAIFFFPVINQAIRNIRMRVVMQLHRSSIQTWEKYDITEILSASTRISQSLRGFMNISFVNILPAVINIGVFSIAMWHTHRATWYFSPLILLSYSYVYFGIRDFLRARQHCWEATDKANTAMTDSLKNTKFYKFRMAEEETRLSTYFDAEAQGWLHNNFLLHKIPLIQVTWFSIVRGGLIIQLVLLLRVGRLSWTDFIVIERYIALIYKQVSSITHQLQRLLSSVVDLEKVLDLLALPDRTITPSLSPQLHKEAPKTPILQVRNVSFAYTQHERAVLQACSLDIYRGDKVAITGPSGIGKSTLCHLLSGIYQPQQGEILLWGIPLHQLSLTTIGQYIHFVDQEANWVGGATADNPMAKKTQPSHLVHSSNNAHIPAGKRKSKKLSSGEKQRLLLARCLQYQPEVLILDETLSALDEASALELLQLVLTSVPTVILITHRQALVQDFKLIYSLEEGRLKAA